MTSQFAIFGLEKSAVQSEYPYNIGQAWTLREHPLRFKTKEDAHNELNLIHTNQSEYWTYKYVDYVIMEVFS